MLRSRYLIRLDDACPTMNRQLWGRIEDVLDKYGLKPMVGVIPHNEDPQQMIDSVDDLFWSKVKTWQNKGWAIALHGYNHCYTSSGGLNGLNPMWERSEFAGLALAEQKEKIKRGVEVMRNNGINPQFFFAPSHTFDENTLNALREESDIRIISDTIATKPYRYGDFVIIPQFGGQCREMALPGLYTFCLHPNTMSESSFSKTESFLRTHKDSFISFDQLNIDNLSKKSIFDRFLSWFYFSLRSLKK